MNLRDLSPSHLNEAAVIPNLAAAIIALHEHLDEIHADWGFFIHPAEWSNSSVHGRIQMLATWISFACTRA